MATSLNPFKSKTAPNLLDQLVTKQLELEDTTIDKAEEAAQLASLAAEAKNASKVASSHAAAVDTAINILTKAGVTL